uniref:SET domain containing 4 n=1 Tax=Seriola dumerili TaxID=41447 RepID=A0A3B4ULA9_SERDU
MLSMLVSFITSLSLSVSSVSLCHQLQYVKLMKFLHQRGFTSTLLQPALFTGTALPGQLLISLPESCLLTTSTVLDSYLGQYIKSWKRRLSPLLALCVFLVCERHQGEASDWLPYIDVLPTTYTCPAYFTDDVVTALPACVRRRALEQREAVREIHSSNQDFFRSLQPILNQPVEEVLTYEALRWAWCSVNTRSVFMSHPSNNFLSGQDVYALAPFLDLLNHQPDVQVKASFNDVTRCYEIRSVSGTARFQQAFINYGSHDNQRLLLENLTVSSDGPSWRLMTALRLLSMPQTLYHQWKAVLLGQAVCEEREEWSVHTAQTLCQRLLQDTHTALDKIADLMQRCDQSVREQLGVVRSLRREERCILGRCLEVLQGMMRQPDEPLSCQPGVDTVS